MKYGNHKIMNLKQKEELKAKIENLEMLISCIDESWLIKISHMDINKLAMGYLTSIQLMNGTDQFITMSIILRMLNGLLRQMKEGLND